MSRIGKKPILIPSSIQVANNNNLFQVTNGKVSSDLQVSSKFNLVVDNSQITILPIDQDCKETKRLWGLTRTLVDNMIVGIHKGFSISLDIVGVGYKAAIAGEYMTINIGYSHPIKIRVPKNIEIKIPKPTNIIISGHDKQAVGQFSATIQGLRKFDPYKGKGIYPTGKKMIRKVGKKK